MTTVQSLLQNCEVNNTDNLTSSRVVGKKYSVLQAVNVSSPVPQRAAILQLHSENVNQTAVIHAAAPDTRGTAVPGKTTQTSS